MPVDISVPLNELKIARITDKLPVILGRQPNVAKTTLAAADTPTITLSAPAAATSITNGVRISPRRLDSTFIDVDGDGNFEILGVPSGKLLITSGDCCRPDLLTGGSAQAARWSPRFRIGYYGTKIEFYFRAPAATLRYRVRVNGVIVAGADSLVSTVATAGQRYRLILEFPSAASRVIEAEVEDPEFGGVWVEPTAGVFRPVSHRPKILALGDSITAGANGLGRNDTWVRWVGEYLDAEWFNAGIGGSGWINAPAYDTRVGDVTSAAADVILLFGAQNDMSGNTAAQIKEAARTTTEAIIAANPKALCIIFGPWNTTQNNDLIRTQTEQALRELAGELQVPYVSIRDPLDLYPDTSTWAPSTAYKAGDYYAYNGFVWDVIVDHTSGASTPDATKARCTSIINGTGRVGAETGVGNSDQFISSDAVHPTQPFSPYFGRYIATRISEAIAKL